MDLPRTQNSFVNSEETEGVTYTEQKHQLSIAEAAIEYTSLS